MSDRGFGHFQVEWSAPPTAPRPVWQTALCGAIAGVAILGVAAIIMCVAVLVVIEMNSFSHSDRTDDFNSPTSATTTATTTPGRTYRKADIAFVSWNQGLTADSSKLEARLRNENVGIIVVCQQEATEGIKNPSEALWHRTYKKKLAGVTKPMSGKLASIYLTVFQRKTAQISVAIGKKGTERVSYIINGKGSIWAELQIRNGSKVHSVVALCMHLPTTSSDREQGLVQILSDVTEEYSPGKPECEDPDIVPPKLCWGLSLSSFVMGDLNYRLDGRLWKPQATYVIASQGTNTCPGRQVKLTSKAACEDAATDLERSFGGEEDSADYPGGCYAIMKTQDVFWNMASPSRSQAQSAPICLEEGTVIAITSTDHKDFPDGQFFNFKQPAQFISGDMKIIKVTQCRRGSAVWQGSVIMWAGNNGGTGDVDSYGRRDPDDKAAPGQWLVHDVITTLAACPEASRDWLANHLINRNWSSLHELDSIKRSKLLADRASFQCNIPQYLPTYKLHDPDVCAANDVANCYLPTEEVAKKDGLLQLGWLDRICWLDTTSRGVTLQSDEGLHDLAMKSDHVPVLWKFQIHALEQESSETSWQQ